jgi:L-threonylcarbamoyladenylate synthase
MTQVIQVDHSSGSFASLLPALETMKAGGVVAYPTETFYGLGVDAFNENAIEKIYAIKKRDFSQPLSVLIPRQDSLSKYAREVSGLARKLTDRFWPGPLTLVVSATPCLPALLCSQTNRIAVRVSSHPIAQALTEGLGSPITATSANISGAPSPTTPEEVRGQLGNTIDLIIDGGQTAGNKPSTIVDVTQSPPQLIREGAIPFGVIEVLLRL